MADLDQATLQPLERIELNAIHHPAWDAPVICRVEVDLPGWLAQLTGENKWEVISEDEDETCISFAMREKAFKASSKLTHKSNPKLAEVTLYHNGYAVVDVEGKALFDGALTSGTSRCAHLSYFHADSGEPIILS
jgi:hypothetical protein